MKLAVLLWAACMLLGAGRPRLPPQRTVPWSTNAPVVDQQQTEDIAGGRVDRVRMAASFHTSTTNPTSSSKSSIRLAHIWAAVVAEHLAWAVHPSAAHDQARGAAHRQRAASLTSSATFGFQNRTVAYQAPNAVVDFELSATSGSLTPSRSFRVPCTMTTAGSLAGAAFA